MTLGFERPSYTVSEPGRASQVTQEVCLVVSQGSIGRNLIVIPSWTEGTARGGCGHVVARYCNMRVVCTYICPLGTTHVVIIDAQVSLLLASQGLHE